MLLLFFFFNLSSLWFSVTKSTDTVEYLCRSLMEESCINDCRDQCAYFFFFSVKVCYWPAESFPPVVFTPHSAFKSGGEKNTCVQGQHGCAPPPPMRRPSFSFPRRLVASTVVCIRLMSTQAAWYTLQRLDANFTWRYPPAPPSYSLPDLTGLLV